MENKRHKTYKREAAGVAGGYLLANSVAAYGLDSETALTLVTQTWDTTLVFIGAMLGAEWHSTQSKWAAPKEGSYDDL